MKKTLLITLAIASLTLAGCVQQALTKNQNLNQPAANTNQNLNTNQPDVISDNEETTTIIQASTTEETDIGKIHIETPVVQTVNCGDPDCFEQKFSNCEKATLKAAAMGAEYYYEIIGPESGKCKILTRYNTNPNPAWVGKNMICLYDNSLNLQEANQQVMDGVMAGTIQCGGELYEILSSLNN